MPTLKVVLLGDSSVGKLSLVNRFANNTFDPHLANTIGAAFISKHHAVDQKNVKFEIWDTAGQERYKSLTPMYYRNAKVALVCFDLSNAEQSFERAKYWIHQLNLLGPPEIEIRLVGTKLDLVEEPGKRDESGAMAAIGDFCASHDLTWVATSAKQNTGITEIFDGIVESLDNSFFLQLDLEQPESIQENVLIRFNNRSSSCC